MNEIKLTSYSHGAGCGCKIAPEVLDKILSGNHSALTFKELLVGNRSRDDAAAYDLGDGRVLVSTTDFFMPIVDDPYTFGRIAAANAISDVYAMGAKPIMAIAILGWPINTLAPDIAARVVEGGSSMCSEAGIPLAGGHSIDCPEPVFGLSVNGIVKSENLKRNDTAQNGDLLYLTKKIGVGILTTAEKKGILVDEHRSASASQMMKLNDIGYVFGELPYVHSMTDVTGFGLLGHLIEMAEGSGLSAEIRLDHVSPIVDDIGSYIKANSVPGGTNRNWSSYGGKVGISDGLDSEFVRSFLADPQTSGGLLVAVAPSESDTFEKYLTDKGYSAHSRPIGKMLARTEKVVHVR
jgi:selenide,water dikinase